MSTTADVQIFGPDRPAAARAACFELQQATAAREAAGGGWAPERFHARVREARAVHAMYNHCDEIVGDERWARVNSGTVPAPNIGDTCCGKCLGASCYVDQVTGA